MAVFEKELEELKEKRSKLDLSITSTERQIEKYPMFKEFMKKHNIESIECFRNTNNIEDLQKSFHLRN